MVGTIRLDCEDRKGNRFAIKVPAEFEATHPDKFVWDGFVIPVGTIYSCSFTPEENAKD